MARPLVSWGTKYMKCGWSEYECAVCVTHMLDLEMCNKNIKCFINNFIWIMSK